MCMVKICICFFRLKVKTMSEKRFRVNDLVKYVYSDIGEYVDEKHTPTPLRNDKLCKLLNELNEENKTLKKENEDLREVNKENQLLHEENVKQCERWKNLYEIKDAEVTARVDALNKVCEYYTSEVLFKSDVDPNKAVKEVINRILNTEVENDE